MDPVRVGGNERGAQLLETGLGNRHPLLCGTKMARALLEDPGRQGDRGHKRGSVAAAYGGERSAVVPDLYYCWIIPQSLRLERLEIGEDSGRAQESGQGALGHSSAADLLRKQRDWHYLAGAAAAVGRSPLFGVPPSRERVRPAFGCSQRATVPPNVRFPGRSAHETSARAAMTSGAAMWATYHGPPMSPATASVIAAPVSSKVIPAYAHSLRRGNRGTRIAMPPSTFQTPRIRAK